MKKTEVQLLGPRFQRVVHVISIGNQMILSASWNKKAQAGSCAKSPYARANFSKTTKHCTSP